MPPTYTGFNAFAGFVEEVTWGTAVSPRTNFLPLLPGANLARNVEYEGRPSLRLAGSRVRHGRFRVADNSGGPLGFEMNYQTVGILLKHALGGLATAGVGPYTHTYTMTKDLPTGLTIAFARGEDDQEVFEGCKINTLTIAVSAGGVMTATADIIAETSGGRSGTVDTPTFSADTKSDVILHHHGVDLTFDGATACLRELTLTINNNLERRPCIGSLLTREPKGGFADVEFSATVEVDDDFYADHTDFTEADFSVAFTLGTNSFTINMQNASISDEDSPVDTPNILDQTLTFVATQEGAQGGLELVMINDEASGIGNG